MDIEFLCPYCSQKLCVESGNSGTSVPCPKCGKNFIIPPDNVNEACSKYGCGSCLLTLLVCFFGFCLLFVGLEGVSYFFNSYSVSEKTYVSQGYGVEWPLTVPSGKVVRRDVPEGTLVLFKAHTGEFYALNGTARNLGYADIHAITKVAKNYGDGDVLYMDVSGLEMVGVRK